LLTPHAEYLALAEQPHRRHDAYRTLFDESQDPAVATAIRAATDAGHPLVGERLKQKLAGEGRRVERGKPGRRPKEAVGDEVLSRSLELGL
jgi:hypothetical protein